MKIFLVNVLLGAGLFLLIILMDLAMHFPLSGIILKELQPFQGTEKTEITIIFLFIIYFISKAVIGFVKEKKGSPSSQNESE